MAIYDLINRQKAEIEEQDQAIINALKRMGQIRAEAIKEFAERLKQYTECMGECTVDNPLMETHSVVREKYIDQIAKEMKGEQ